jgi:nucleotidyltransferase/DNA polymerase involved in DNA repair
MFWSLKHSKKWKNIVRRPETMFRAKKQCSERPNNVPSQKTMFEAKKQCLGEILAEKTSPEDLAP